MKTRLITGINTLIISLLLDTLLTHERSDILPSVYNLEHDATPSWSGYNYQGKVALFVIVDIIYNLHTKGLQREIQNYSIEFEWVEDFSILYNHDGNEQYKTIHQVKALDTTVLNDYSEALFGLASKLIGKGEIETAYLHTWKPIAIEECCLWDDTIKGLINNQSKKIELINDLKNLLSDASGLDAVVERIKNPRKGKIPHLIERIKENLDFDEEINNEILRHAIEQALNKAENKQEEFFNQLTNQVINKIKVFSYDGISNCDLDKIEQLILMRIRSYLDLIRAVIKDDNYIITLYHYLLGKIDGHVTARHKKHKEKSICLKDFEDILNNQNLNNRSKDYYIYYLKKKFFDVHLDFCKLCEKDDLYCTKDCKLSLAIEEIRKMDMETFEKFCRAVCPTVDGDITDIEVYPKYLEIDKTNVLLTIASEIKKEFEKHNEMILYKTPEKKSLLLTSLKKPITGNPEANVCIKIVQNKMIDGVLMDIDELISMDMDVNSIFECAKKFNADIEILDNGLYNSDHILNCKKVSIRRLEDVQRRIDNC